MNLLTVVLNEGQEESERTDPIVASASSADAIIFVALFVRCKFICITISILHCNINQLKYILLDTSKKV